MIDPERAAHMEALAVELDQTVDRLDAALIRQAQLADEVIAIRQRNRWLVALTSAALLIALGAVVVGITALRVDAEREEDRRAAEDRLCARTVMIRDDNRSMWLWLINRVTGTSELAPEASVQLDLLLPALTCADSHPVPVGDE